MKFNQSVSFLAIEILTGIFAVLSLLIVVGCDQTPARQDQADSSTSDSGPIRVKQPADAALDERLADELKRHVVHLAETIGQRNLDKYESLCAAADYVEQQFQLLKYRTSRQTYRVSELDCFNIVAQISGATVPDEIVIVGAHYDSVRGSPGANDNGSGVASLLALAGRLADAKPHRTLRLVGFTNEEPPYFQKPDEMGSWQYARQCRRNGDNIVAVLSLETMGYFSDAKNSQNYPPPLNEQYPTTGNFIGFVSNVESTALVRKAIGVFQEHATLPSEFAALPASIPGVGWSDHWSFWQEGYPGIMITDTAPFRYPHYHLATDTPDKLDYERLGKVVAGLLPVINALLENADRE